jgi:hypothetical protein
MNPRHCEGSHLTVTSEQNVCLQTFHTVLFSVLTFISVVNVFGFTTAFINDSPPLGRFPLLFFLQLFSGLLSQQQL